MPNNLLALGFFSYREGEDKGGGSVSFAFLIPAGLFIALMLFIQSLQY